MNAISIIFPHQLYEKNAAISKNRKIILVEEWLFFRQYSFHKLKLILHRSSMKRYSQWLSQQKHEVEYIEATDKLSDIRELIRWMAKNTVEEIHYTDTVDNWLEKRIENTANEYGIVTKQYPTTNFLNRMKDVNKFFDDKQTYFQTDFYKWQRQHRNILMEDKGSPVGVNGLMILRTGKNYQRMSRYRPLIFQLKMNMCGKQGPM